MPPYESQEPWAGGWSAGVNSLRTAEVSWQAGGNRHVSLAHGVTLSLLLHPPLFPGLGAHRVLEEMRLWAPTSSVQRPPAGGRDA